MRTTGVGISSIPPSLGHALFQGTQLQDSMTNGPLGNVVSSWVTHS